MDDIELTFDEDVFEFIVDKALEFKLGARGLRSIVEAVMMDAMYSMPSANEKTLHVTLEYAKEKFEKSDVNRLQMTWPAVFKIMNSMAKKDNLTEELKKHLFWYL